MTMNPSLAPAGIIAATSAVVVWPHRRGGWARCLLRVRVVRDDKSTAHGSTTAVISMLRDNQRARGIGSDFAGCANAAATAFLPATDPQTVTWYAHHGPFSSYDPAGPETLERVRLRWDGQHYLDPHDTDFLLLDPAEFAAQSRALQLEAVEELLGRWTWDTTVPNRGPTSG